MVHPTKIATCCHCGSKAALKLDAGRHELSCANCGAPLRDLKMLPKPAAAAPKAVSHQPVLRHFPQKAKALAYKQSKPRKVKKRKSWFKDLAEDVFDFLEDIFD